MLPGLNHAIDDAGRLVEALTKAGGGTQAERVAAYEAEMRPRAGQEVDLSRLNTEMLHDWSRFTQSPLLSKGLAKTPAEFVPVASTDLKTAVEGPSGRG